MPHRGISVAILLFWAVAAGTLFTRDVLPDYLLGPPPDLRAISQAGKPEGPVKWSILARDVGSEENPRAVGQITTETQTKRDGWVRMTSTAWLDSGELLRGTAFESSDGGRIAVAGACEIDATGNLQNFRIGVRLDELSRQDMLTIEGKLRKDVLEVSTRGILPVLNGTHVLPYRPRGIVQNSLGPMDRMPGLHVGQTWQTQVVSPLTGMVQECRVEVAGTEHIIWGSSPVLTYKVVTRMMPVSATTWVRPDGLVLRQEVPLPPRIRLIMDRMPGDDGANSPSGRAPRRERTGR